MEFDSMNLNIHPCLWFNDNGSEASNFYCSVFPNSKIVSQNPVITSLTLCGLPIKALNGGPGFEKNPSISFTVLCHDQISAQEIWNKLLDGGSVMMPFGKYDWSECYGWLQDKYSMSWQINVSSSTVEPIHIKPSLLFTNHVFGKAQDAIDFYTRLFKNSSFDLLMQYPVSHANEGLLMYAEYTINGRSFIAMDGPGEHNFQFNEGVSFVVECDGQEEIDFFWNALTKKGEEGKCGWLKDQFGVSWQIVPKNLGQLLFESSNSQKAMQSMLKMKKIIIADLK
jgi:predicted 3-demethylubiquinone-9 3-methyltransferase (glyoxalase superfamily)